jgi:hypothetical protein
LRPVRDRRITDAIDHQTGARIRETAAQHEA